MRLLMLAVSLLVAGCASRYPDNCDVKQPDREGPGYTVGQFPCKLTHYSGEKKP
jgi:hypothetical protein